ncbi:MAG: hypothetical protein SOY73_16670 [Blautia sp.]|nr:hypothetical protein [Blautia sp.]
MEEQNKEIEEQENKNASEDSRQNMQPIPTRSVILWVLAGGYLLYSGYTLCKNVLDGVEGSSWGFFVAGAIFIVLGAVLVFMGLKNYNDKIKAEREAEEAAEASEENDALAADNTVEKMETSEKNKINH